MSRCFRARRGQDLAQFADVGVDAVERIAHLERDGGVHDVLRGGAPMDVAAGFAAHRDELVHERQDRIADDVGLVAHVIEVDALDLRLACDDLGRLGRNHADTRLGLGERDFGIDVALDQRASRRTSAASSGVPKASRNRMESTTVLAGTKDDMRPPS